MHAAASCQLHCFSGDGCRCTSAAFGRPRPTLARHPTPTDVPLVDSSGPASTSCACRASSAVTPCPVTPEPPSPPLPGPPQPAPAIGRLLKLPVVIGGLPSDRQKGWLGLVASAVERPLATALEVPRSQGVCWSRR